MPPVLHRQAEAGRLGWPGRALRAPVRAPEVGQGLTVSGSPRVADPQRRGALYAVKLAALVRDHLSVPASGVPQSFPGGAALLHGDEAWVLLEDGPERGLGPALAWADQRGAAGLHVVVESAQAAGVLARRAVAFRHGPRIWRVDGRQLVEAEPAPAPESPPVDPRALALIPLLEAGGADAVIEHGEVLGEVGGLEVARVVVDEAGARLEVGIGPHDREAFALVHGEVPPVEALAGVVAAVGPHRRPGAPPHALNRLSPERALRSLVVADPASVGCHRLRPVAGPEPRRGIRERQPSVAVGDAPGGPVVVVCSTGIDPDLVPFAADARAVIDPHAELLLVVPARDDHPVTRRLAAALARPARVVPVWDETAGNGPSAGG